MAGYFAIDVFVLVNHNIAAQMLYRAVEWSYSNLAIVSPLYYLVANLLNINRNIPKRRE